jgi:hypothetical protein
VRTALPFAGQDDGRHGHVAKSHAGFHVVDVFDVASVAEEASGTFHYLHQ